MKIYSFFALLLLGILAIAQKPIVPPGKYIADPSAHVWEDGKLHIYGSVDESQDYYCSWRHHALSTSDMINWEIEENVFASKGDNNQELWINFYGAGEDMYAVHWVRFE